jgi:hypothetical protein
MRVVYEARPVKRERATSAEMEARHQAIIDIVAETSPTSVRHTYYVAITRGLVKKDVSGSRSNYGKVQRAVLQLRRSGDIDYSDIVDSTRWMRKPSSWDDLDDYLYNVQTSYRRNLWADGGTRLEVWCESESIAGVLVDVTSRWDVPLLPTHGYSSETFAWGAAETWRNSIQEPTILYVGDLDKHGKQIEADLRSKLEGFYEAEVDWSRIGITDAQVEQYGLQDMATVPGHWEAEALPPDAMRAALEEAILFYVDDVALSVHREAEASERDILKSIIETAEGK